MTKIEKSVAFVVNGKVVAKTGDEGKFDKVLQDSPATVVHLDKSVEVDKFARHGGYHEMGPQQSLVG